MDSQFYHNDKFTYKVDFFQGEYHITRITHQDYLSGNTHVGTFFAKHKNYDKALKLIPSQGNENARRA